ncbi:hypothetical protein TNCV_92841 [Trichonephila clavipes]|nr:hypothetical protein TNCV_92841 [Trichonephila clavipes]
MAADIESYHKETRNVSDPASRATGCVGQLFVQSSKNIIDAESDDENGLTNAAPVPTSSELRNIMKNTRSYSDAHSKDEMNNKMDDIEQFDAKKRQRKEKYEINF